MRSTRRGARLTALGLALSMVSPLLAGCGRDNAGAGGPPGPTSDVRGARATTGAPGPASRPGMTGRQKVALLAGAAALYYLYNKHKKERGAGAQGQYYLSKNGRVYYRDPNGKAVWVTPPQQAIEVPASEAPAYSGYAGYNGQTTGRSFGGYGAEGMAPAAAGGPPGPR